MMERRSKAFLNWLSTTSRSSRTPSNLPLILPKAMAGRTLPKRREGCYEQCRACSDPTPDPRCDGRAARRRCGQRAGLTAKPRWRPVCWPKRSSKRSARSYSGQSRGSRTHATTTTASSNEKISKMDRLSGVVVAKLPLHSQSGF